MRRFHFWAMIVWAIPLSIATIIWWKNSIAWVAYMSVYACAMGHFSSYQATRAEDSNNSSNGT